MTMTLKYDVETIQNDEGTWYCLADLHIADWFATKKAYLCAATVNKCFFARPVKETEKAIQFEVSKFAADDSEYKLYHRWSIWTPKSVIGAIC